MNEEMRELLALYALGGLTTEEQQEVENYLAAHPEAEDDLHELVATTTTLRHVPPAITPPTYIKQALVARAMADSRARLPQPTVTSPTFWQKVQAFFAQPTLGLIATALALVLFIWLFLLNMQLGKVTQQIANQQTAMNGLLSQFQSLQSDNTALVDEIDNLTAENQSLQQQISSLIEERNAAQTTMARLEQENGDLAAELTAVLAQNETLRTDLVTVQALNDLLQDDLAARSEIVDLFTSPETQQALLPGTETQPQAEAHLLFDPETNVAVLFVDGLSTLAQGEVYQVLLIRDDGHDTAETFAVDVQGQKALIVHAQAPLNTFTSVGISIEPEGGSPQRTGDVVVLGPLVNS